MKYIYKMESVIVTIAAVLCAILLLKLINKLRLLVSWRVNCWFCNNNFWVKYPDRNSWTCPKCEQYNGFTKDGDYNKQIFTTNDQTFKTPKVFQKTPPKNGLCKMCNINQQLKVTQMANFVPMNENNYDEEIEGYRLQLEKAYKLCSPCKKVVQTKLHKEKETLLGSKLLEKRTPEKNIPKKEKQSKLLKSFVNSTSKLIAFILFILVSVEFYKNITKYESLHSTITNIKEILTGLLERIYSIIKMKTLQTFPILETYDINNIILLHTKWPNMFDFKLGHFDNINRTTQKALGGFVCLIQIVGNVWNVNSLKYTVAFDLLWSVFVIMSIAHKSVAIHPVIISCFKMASVLTILVVYKTMKMKKNKTTLRSQVTPIKMKTLNHASMNKLIDEDDSITLDTDDDVSLSKFGVHNYSESSNETISPLNGTLMSGRNFTPRNDSVWTKPKLNSTFCVNPVLTKSPSSVSDTIFAKPNFKKYQKLAKDDSDSELDESISSLCIGSPNKSKKKTNPVFSLRKFTASPNFITPTPVTRTKPLISPSKLGHSTSWVAGGYWGTEGERHLFSINGSRSSSQSSGFESQTSSMNQRNIFSQPPSREESICGEPMVQDRFPNMSSLGNCQPMNNFSRMSSPVFPQMQFNGYVHIPQPRLPQHNFSHNLFAQQSQYVHREIFKAPGGPGLMKSPQVNTFSSH